ncbi:MAG: alpha/beta hydrolase [Ignavibacteriae bacterium]|nr:alpha/beta hydrolase [Ignavibacteriota bacterium]
MNNKVKIKEGNISFQKINSEIYREKELLVFLHDGLGSIRQWGSFPEKLSGELKLPAIVYSRLGHNGSDDAPSKKDKGFFKREANCLYEILNKLNFSNKVILIGSSDGGTISLLFAATYPEKVKAVVTLAAHTFVEDVTVNGIMDSVEKFRNGNFRNALEKYHGEKTESLFAGWSGLWISANFRDWNIFSDLKRIECPVLSLQGNMDEYGTIEQLYSIKNNVKSECGIEMIKDAGHFPYFDKSKEVNGLIKEFLSDKLS